ncbi:MAG: hypothetical protein F4213_08975 [Boseongicola sp. SB0677_bin_26]|nr:hypothetical protein [Boseongicola sp. SB0665_bin_10]MYG26143.1 hypothetical protein [Boseongicola sp. SB0677_bin_26]
MRRKPPTCWLAATLGLAARDDGTDPGRADVGGIAGCVAGNAIDEGGCTKGTATGAVAGASVDDA